MKRTPLRRVGKKGRKRQRALAKIKPPEDGCCEICGRPPDWRGLGKHHKVFRSHGGDDTRENIVWACGDCHDEKHHR